MLIEISQLIFLFLFLNTLFYFINSIFKLKIENKLFCGLFGYVGTDKPDIFKIHILGLFNESRGTDSCGLYWNGGVLKGISEKSKYSVFIQKYVFEEFNQKNYAVIGHTRSKTKGFATEDNAHPFQIVLPENPNEPFLVGAHNGVIHNDEELAKQYGIDVSHCNVDSHILFEILARGKKNFKVLSEYIGKAALLFSYNADPSSLYIWRGESALNSGHNNFTYEERPLYYYKKENGYYISSLKEALMAIGAEFDEVIEVPANTLIKIKGVKIITTPISRNNAHQERDVTNMGKHFSSLKEDERRIGTGLNEYYSMHSINKNKNKNKNIKTLFELDNEKIISKQNEKELLNNLVKELLNQNLLINNLKKYALDINFEKIDEKYTKGDKIYFFKGLYYRNGHIVNINSEGSLYLCEDGSKVYVNEHTEPFKKHNNNKVSKKEYIIDGYMLKNQESLDLITLNRDSYIRTTGVGINKKIKLHRYLSSTLVSFPILQSELSSEKFWIINKEPANGVYLPKYSNKCYIFNSGHLLCILDTNKEGLESIDMISDFCRKDLIADKIDNYVDNSKNESINSNRNYTAKTNRVYTEFPVTVEEPEKIIPLHLNFPDDDGVLYEENLNDFSKSLKNQDNKIVDSLIDSFAYDFQSGVEAFNDMLSDDFSSNFTKEEIKNAKQLKKSINELKKIIME